MLVKEGVMDIEEYPASIVYLIKNFTGGGPGDPSTTWDDVELADFAGYSNVNVSDTTGFTDDGWRENHYQPAVFQHNGDPQGTSNQVVAWALGNSSRLDYIEAFASPITMDHESLAIEIFVAIQYGDD